MYGILCVMLDLHVRKLFYWTRCVVSLTFLSSDTFYPGNINTWRSYYGSIFLLAWYVSWAFELFSINLIVFVISNSLNSFM